MTQDLFLILNATDISLTDDDFLDGIAIQREREGIVYSARLIDRDCTGGANLKIENDRIILEHISVTRNRALIVEVLHDHCVADSLSAVPKVLPDLKIIRHTGIEERFWFKPILILLILVAPMYLGNIFSQFAGYPEGHLSFLAFGFVPMVPSFFVAIFFTDKIEDMIDGPTRSEFNSLKNNS